MESARGRPAGSSRSGKERATFYVSPELLRFLNYVGEQHLGTTSASVALNYVLSSVLKQRVEELDPVVVSYKKETVRQKQF